MSLSLQMRSWPMTPGGRLWHVPQPTVPWCPLPVPAKLSPAVKTSSQKAEAVPGLRSYPSDIAGKDPAPQIPSTHVGKSQGFTNREELLPPAFCPSPEQPNYLLVHLLPSSHLHVSRSSYRPPHPPCGSAALGFTPSCDSPRQAQALLTQSCSTLSRRIWKPFSLIILKSSNKQTIFSPARSFFFILLT